MGKVAILVDGGFYLKRAHYLFGEKTPKERAKELYDYCLKHVDYFKSDLYRIFYYDCKPSEKSVFHPLTRKSTCLKYTNQYKWATEFQEAIVCIRKVALRLGELLDSNLNYSLTPEAVKKLCSKTISVDDLTEDDFRLNIQQKGVDMRIGLDIASLANKRLVDQIILIAGDSDFVPAAKHARREGIDFILDPMWHNIKDSLNEHIDGLHTCCPRPNHTATPLFQNSEKIILLE